MKMNASAAAVRSLLLEAVVVGAAGLALALLANQLSPRGLVLTRDYFGSAARGTPGDSGAPGSSPVGPRRVASDARSPEPGLNRDGFRTVNLDEVRRWQADPRRERGLIVFVDARADRPYRDGHIPGAIQFDPFYPEKRLTEVLAACSLADQVVIYCTGDDCTDSNLAAHLLRDAGVPVARLAVFVGGIGEWKARRSLLEVGERNSGDLRTP
jgi:rhodanese-related sulfurtransferase